VSPFKCHNFFSVQVFIQYYAFQSPPLLSIYLRVPLLWYPGLTPKRPQDYPFPFRFTILNCKETLLLAGTRLRILSWNQTSDLRLKLLLLLLLLHQKLPLSYTTAKEKEKSTKSLPIWGNICEDCSELPIYVRNFLRQKHTISSTIDQPVPLNFLEEEKNCSEVGCLIVWQNKCVLALEDIIGEIFSFARLCSCNVATGDIMQ